MRQIGSDLAADPREPIAFVQGEYADLSNEATAAAYRQYTWNKFTEMSHKYCSASLNFASGDMSEIESQRFKTCLSKYSQSFALYQQEEGVHHSAIAAIEEQGGDRFAKFNEYDRF